MTDLYEVTVVGNEPPGTPCADLGESMGPRLMERFENVTPWLSDYKVSQQGLTRRRLREPKSRKLQVNLCSKKFCNKPRNWNWCYWNGCKCSCGKRRQLQNDKQTKAIGGNIQEARRSMQNLLETEAAKVQGCKLGMIFHRINIDDSEL